MSDLFEILFPIVLGLSVGSVITLNVIDNPYRLKQEAISHGYASYEIVDQKTGKTEFKWKEQGK